MPTGFVLADVIQGEIDKGIAEQVSVPSKHSSAFDEWLSNDYEDAPEIIKTFYLWNLTNPNEYLKGAKPNYEEIGPFVFRQFDYKYDVEFSKNKEEVTFKRYSNYVQLYGDKVSEVNITNINPGYLGAIETAGGTDLDLIKYALPLTYSILKDTFEDEYSTIFPQTVYREGFKLNSSNTNYIERNITSVIGSVDNIFASDDSYLEFASNKTSLSVDFIIKVNSSQQEEIIPRTFRYEFSSNSTIENLQISLYNFTSQTYMPYTLLNNINTNDKKDYFNVPINDLSHVNRTNGESTMILRLDCSNSTHSSDYLLKIDRLFVSMVTTHFDANSRAFYVQGYPFPSSEEVFFEEWANDFFPYPNRSLVPPSINNTSSITTIREVAAQRVAIEGSPTTWEGVDIDGRAPYNFINYPGSSYSDLNITKYYETISGYYYGVPYNNITQEMCQKLWDKNNPNSLTGFDYEVNKIWFEALDNDTESKNSLMTKFDLNPLQLDRILKWINVSIHTWGKNVIEWTLNDWNSGYIVTRTAEEWLFTANDTAIWENQAHQNKDTRLADVALFDDIESNSEAETIPVDKITINTGRNDVSQVGQTLEFNGQDTIYLWATPEEIEGTDGLQFGPGVTKDDALKVFNSDLMRVVELDYHKDAEIYDINLLRFKLAADTFSVNPNYYMSTSGLINLAPIEKYHDVPVRVSKPHLLGTDISILRAVDGMNPNGDLHDTYIDVEPYTGITMNAKLRIQVNFEVSATEIYHPNVTHAVMPIAWYEQSGEITEELAELFKDQLYWAVDLKEKLPLYCLGLGAVLFIPGAALMTSNIVKRRRIAKRGKILKHYSRNKKETLKLDD